MSGEMPDRISFSNLETESVLKGEINIHNTRNIEDVYF